MREGNRAATGLACARWAQGTAGGLSDEGADRPDALESNWRGGFRGLGSRAAGASYALREAAGDGAGVEVQAASKRRGEGGKLINDHGGEQEEANSCQQDAELLERVVSLVLEYLDYYRILNLQHQCKQDNGGHLEYDA